MIGHVERPAGTSTSNISMDTAKKQSMDQRVKPHEYLEQFRHDGDFASKSLLKTSLETSWSREIHQGGKSVVAIQEAYVSRRALGTMDRL